MRPLFGSAGEARLPLLAIEAHRRHVRTLLLIAESAAITLLVAVLIAERMFGGEGGGRE